MTLQTSAFTLTPEQTNLVLSNARTQSFVQRLGQRIPLSLAGGTGVSANDLTGGFVNAENDAKPVEQQALTTVSVPLREWAVQIPVSKRVVDANLDGIVDIIQQKLAEAFARAIDTLASSGGGYSGATYLNQTTKSVALGTAAATAGGVFKDLNNGLALLVNDGSKLTGSLFDMKAEPIINASVDANGRPVFVDVPVADSNPVYRPGRLLGRPAEFDYGIATGTAGDAAEVLGYMGDFSKVLWGIYGNGFEISISDTATYTTGGALRSAYEHNEYVIRAEALLGAGVVDADTNFVKVLRGAANVES